MDPSPSPAQNCTERALSPRLLTLKSSGISERIAEKVKALKALGKNVIFLVSSNNAGILFIEQCSGVYYESCLMYFSSLVCPNF